MMSTEEADILNSPSIQNIDKYLCLRKLIYDNNEATSHSLIGNLPIENEDEELNVFMILLKIEFILDFKEIDTSEVESLLKMIQLSSAFPKAPFNNQNNNPSRQYMRVKYNDLYNDFQYLCNPTVTIFKFMESVSKKLTTLSSIPDTDSDYVIDLAVDIYSKVVDCCLMAGSDFRKKNILKFLNDTLGITNKTNIDSEIANRFNRNLNDSVRSIFTMISEEKFILFTQYEKFLENSRTPITRRIAKLNSSLLISNFLENNISLLPKYYVNVHLDKITQLFMIPTELDIEELVSHMIVEGKLPLGTCIDQMEQTLTFGEFQPEYDTFDTHVKEVSEMVDKIANLIQATSI